MLKKLKVKLTGVCPMLVHNSQLADPTNEFVKEIKKVSSKRKKTEEDHEAMSHIEFMGSFYINEEDQYIIPSDNIEASVRDGAKKERAGKIAQAAIFVYDDFILTQYDGPENVEERFKDKRCIDKRMVRIGAARILRTRPKFTNWVAVGEILFDPTQIDKETLERWLDVAGQQSGIGDYRPKFGRFETKVLKR